MEIYHKLGELYHKLPTNHKSLVLNRLLIHSTNKNSEVVEKECIIIIKLAKNKFEESPNIKQTISQFISITVVNATILFKSCCANKRIVASIIASIANDINKYKT